MMFPSLASLPKAFLLLSFSTAHLTFCLFLFRFSTSLSLILPTFPLPLFPLFSLLIVSVASTFSVPLLYFLFSESSLFCIFRSFFCPFSPCFLLFRHSVVSTSPASFSYFLFYLSYFLIHFTFPFPHPFLFHPFMPSFSSSSVNHSFSLLLHIFLLLPSISFFYSLRRAVSLYT